MQQLPKSVKNVVIAGGGTAGWMTAAALSKLLGKSLNITLVESDQIATIGVGEATIPPIRTFHKLLSIDEKTFMRETNATFKLGIQFENWRDVNTDYIHSFGVTGRECWAGEFHHFWLKGKSIGIDDDFGEYCVELQAAKQEKFGALNNQALNFAYHLDATAYAKFLRKMAEQHGVVRQEGKISQVAVAPESGEITHLVLESGQTVEGDFFVDCTGFRGLLIEQALHSGYEDWSHWLLCDAAVAVQTNAVNPPRPYTRSIAHSSGWQWQIPLQHRVGNGLVYSSQTMDREQAFDTLCQHVDGEPITQPNHVRFKPGMRREAWKKNCVAIGLSSGFIEPLESTSIHLIMTGLVRLMRLFPFDGVTQAASREYNQKFGCEMRCILDFIVMHYTVTDRNDSEFWRYCQHMELPESLQHKIDLFKHTGRVFLDEFDIFRVDSWTQVMIGQGLLPNQFHRITDEMSDAELRQFLAGIKAQVTNTVAQLPSHEQFIQQFLQ